MDTVTIGVFCGSAAGTDPAFAQAARDLGCLLANNSIRLVYGGASIGLMGVLADSVLEHGGTVIGVIPEHLSKYEIAHAGLTGLEVVPDMHVRKARMAELSDGFIALPGGVGTLEELFEIVTWSGIGLHTKPCCLLNTHGFYTGLLEFLDNAVEAGFIRTEVRYRLMTSDNPAAALAMITGSAYTS